MTTSIDGAHSREELKEAAVECLAQFARQMIEKNEAYRQRNHLVAALAHIFPSGTRKTEIPGWDPEWHGCCYIDLPTGQISYHYHDSQAYLFESLPPYTKEWDGHDKETVHNRLANVGAPTELDLALEKRSRALQLTAACLQELVHVSVLSENERVVIDLHGKGEKFTIGEILDLAAEALTPASVEHAESE